MKVLILGIGNILLKDDGVGVHIIKQLHHDNVFISDENIELVDGGTAGFDLLPVIQNRDYIILIDAIELQQPPGSIFHFPLTELQSKLPVDSAHDVNITELFRQLELYGETPVVELIGIVPEDVTTFAMELSESVAVAIPKVVEMINGLVEKWKY